MAANHLSRRELLATSLVLAAGSKLGLAAQTKQEETLRARIKGLLLGSAIGDAVGGPVEFQTSDAVAEIIPHCRAWQDDRRLQPADLREFANLLRMHSYEKYRPDAEPYGQWQKAAAAGTVTDDTRHKMVLLAALRETVDAGRLPISEQDLASTYLKYPNSKPLASRSEYRELCEESLREYWRTARWVLGERDLAVASPPARLWGGVPTCCGQMTLLPVACLYPGQPTLAYKAAYALGFFDIGAAKDINSAIVAGLAVALKQPTPTDSATRRQAWQAITDAMRSTDPFHYAEVPYVTRPTVRWLDFAHSAAQRAEQSPKRLYEILEEEGEVRYFWEAHFILAVVFAAIEFCDYDPLAGIMLTLDFGHDTDSSAQLLGAFVGALYGDEFFSDDLRQPVGARLAADYDISLDEWADLLSDLSDRNRYPNVVAIP